MNKTFISQLQGGKYQVNSLIGSGGFGNTYLATQVTLGRKVAIKEFFMKEFCERDESTSQVIIPTEGSRLIVDRYRQKFLKEAQMIASLRNEHIIKIYDIFEENNTAYYVMDYIEGGSLNDAVDSKGPLSESKAIGYIEQISDALSYLHSSNILHLDIKPSNVLIDNDDCLVLIDFGISKHYDSDGGQTSTTPAGISKGYAPIEQYQQGSIANFSPATDIYSLGATMFFLLTGKTPPEASIVNEDGLPNDIDSFTHKIRSVIIKSMSPRRKDRYQSIAEFTNSLKSTDAEKRTYSRKIETEETTILTSAVNIEPKREREPQNITSSYNNNQKSNKTLIIAIVAGLVVLVLCFLIIFSKYDHEERETLKEAVPEGITSVVPVVLETPNFDGMTLSNPKKMTYSLKQVSRVSNDITDDDEWLEKYGSSEQGVKYNFPENWNNQPDENLKSRIPIMLSGKYRSYVTVPSKYDTTRTYNNCLYNVIAYGEKSPRLGDVSIDPDLIIITDYTFNKILCAFDFSNFSLAKFSRSNESEFTKISVENVQIEDNILYATVGHSTYAASSSGYNAYLVAIDLKSQKVKWMTKPLTSNSPFCIYGNTIITGYGFTDEPDYIYVIDKSTGCRLKSIKVANGPEQFSIINNKLYVRTYSYDYVFDLAELRSDAETKTTPTQKQNTSSPLTHATNLNNAGVNTEEHLEVIEEESVPFQLVDEKPLFQGGDASQFSNWVNSRLKYPEEAKQNGVQGRVTLQFTVQIDGSVTNVKVLRGVHSTLDNEAVRVVSLSPKWQPGVHHDRPVPVTYTFPVIFQLR